MRLRDKVIVVTGSTKGIGASIARVCAGEGANLVISGRNAEEGRRIAGELTQRGSKAVFIQCDISNVENARALIDETVAVYGRIDGLVNNAGIFPRVDYLDVTEELYDSVMATNAKGAYFCAQQALRSMMAQKGGSIVNIGSTHWAMGGRALSAYAMSKGALHTLTQHISHHYMRDKVRCNWVTVGWVLSEGELALAEAQGHDLAYMEQLAKRVIPYGTFQTGEDIAMACVYLLSDEAAQVTGTDIKVTGGFKPEALAPQPG
jgi:NAD(P)-dependent dehydrogenase (short-subunit alcohol dehydrogenase family)